MAERIDGRVRAGQVLAEVQTGAMAFREATGRPPGLAIVLVGEHPASLSYIRSKEQAATKAGLYSETHRLPATMAEDALRRFVGRLGEDERLDGILVQLPLPETLRQEEVLAALPPDKDVDGFTTLNQGRLLAGEVGLRPCTPLGVIDLLRWHGVNLDGANVVVIGRSRTVGRPLALMLLEQHASVTVLHSHSQSLAQDVLRADVVIAAAGQAGIVRREMVRPGAVVVDVGINRVDGRLVGDVAADVAEVASAMTPVPGGVGPMTVAMLMANTLEAARWHY
ncbi:MAG: bifunctional 5,10-methylenetetrahydrofolate dehydrogenase/5,10-methenyltetrahydrofolate cyclohydrolase [Sulfobacillus sp.]